MTAGALAGQVALVTGASRGIGRGVALALARAGAIVVGTATSAAGAQAIDAALGSEGLAGAGRILDVGRRETVDAFIDALKKDFGAPAILVNNAGITRDTLAMRMKDDDWSAVLEVNLGGVFALTRAVLRDMMKAKSGRIVNITSVVGHAGNPGQINYAAAKAGVAGMARALAREIGSRNITVNCVAPGFIDTDMTRALTQEQTAALLAQIPLGRLGAVEDVAAAVLFLVGAGGGYVTGSTLHVNGGMYMV